MRQGRDMAVNEALLRVRRLLRSDLQTVVSLSESLEGQDGSFSSLQAVQLLQQEQLLPGEGCNSADSACGWSWQCRLLILPAGGWQLHFVTGSVGLASSSTWLPGHAASGMMPATTDVHVTAVC